MFGPRLLGADRAVGLAYVRALIRTINTHLPDGYEDDALHGAWPRRSAVDEDVVADGPGPAVRLGGPVRHDHPACRTR